MKKLLHLCLTWFKIKLKFIKSIFSFLFKLIHRIRLIDLFTGFGAISILSYIYFKPDEYLKRIFTTEFTVEYIWYLLVLILFLNLSSIYLIIKHINYKRNKHIGLIKSRKYYIAISLLVFIFSIFSTIIFLDKKFDFDKNKIFSTNNLPHSTVNILVTKYKPIISQSYFGQNFTDIDFSTSIFQKLITIVGFNDTIFTIDFYNHYLDFKDGDLKLIKVQDNYDAILCGEILDEKNSFKINNCLYLSKKYNEIIKEIIDTINPINSKLNSEDIFFFYSNPIDFYQKLNQTFLSKDDSLRYFGKTNFNYEFNNEMIFPSNLTFTSSIEKSPYIIIYFLEILNNWQVFKKDTKNKALIIKNINLLDKIICRFPLIDTNEKYKSEIEITFMIQMYSLKAYFLNELQKCNRTINYQIYFEKINNLFLAGKLYYELKGLDEEQINIFEFLFYYTNNQSIISNEHINLSGNGFNEFTCGYNSIYITRLFKVVDSINSNSLLKNCLLNKLSIK